jgi:NAD(P)-dependent dehydrogenase (short-subunit alcohol dehydrogenase family)
VNTLHRCWPGPRGLPSQVQVHYRAAATSTAKPSGGKCNRSDGDWMDVHRRQFDQFRGARRPPEDVIGSPTVTPSGPLLSTSSSSPQVPIRGTDGRLGTVDEVVGAALFLASDGAAFITGHSLAIDCGT